ELVYAPPAGELGSLATKLSGNDLPTQLADALRRLKQIVETGEVVRSDSTPEGHLLASHLKQRPAQPLEGARR
ncbi:MAG: cyclase, partial [Gaiellaceae bacterium]